MDYKVDRESLTSDAWFSDGEDFWVEELVEEAAAELNAMTPQERMQRFRTVARAILEVHRAEDLIPASGKVVVFDHDLPVKYAFYGLLEHHIKCAPIWDSVKMDFVGMLTVTDFIDILRHFYHQDKLADLSNILGNQCIREWASIKSLLRLSVPHLLTTDPECTLLEALEIFSRNRINRLPVLQKEPENSILCLLTHQRILNFLLVKFKTQEELSLLRRISVGDLGVGSFRPLLTVRHQSPLIDVLDLLADHRLSAIPIVDEEGLLVDVYSRSDVLLLAIDKTYSNLDITVKQSLGSHSKARPIPICTLQDSIYTVFKRLVQTRKLRMIVVEPQTRRALGTVSLSDIFEFIIHPNDCASRAASLAVDVSSAAESAVN